MGHRDLYHNGVKLVSVTSLQGIVSKPFLDKWREGLCQESVCGFVAARKVAEEAAEFSNVIHAEIAEYLISGKLAESEWGKKIVFQMKEGNVEKYLVEPEQTLRVDKANLSGSPDAVCKGWGKTFICDHKIKKSLDVATGAQGYGYRLLIKKLYGEDIKDMLIFFGDKKTDRLKLVWIDLDEWGTYFKALVTVWNRHNPARAVKLGALK